MVFDCMISNAADPVLNSSDVYVVKQVVDCKTLKLSNSKKVRLIGVECSEGAQEFVEGNVSLGGSSKDGHKVRLEFDRQQKDQDGSLLAYVYIICPTQLSDTSVLEFPVNHSEKPIKGTMFYEIFLNAKIIEQGFAQPLVTPPNLKYSEFFQKLYQEAKEKKVGLWKGSP